MRGKCYICGNQMNYAFEGNCLCPKDQEELRKEYEELKLDVARDQILKIKIDYKWKRAMLLSHTH